MRLQFKILLFVALQLVIVFAALAAVTLQVGRSSIVESARQGIINDLTSFAQACRSNIKTGSKKELNIVVKKLTYDPNMMYFVLQDPNGRLLLFQSMAPGVDILIRKTAIRENLMKSLRHSGFASHSVYSIKNELVTEMIQEVRDKDQSLGYVRFGVRESGMQKAINNFTKSTLVRLVYIDIFVILASFLATFIFARWLEKPIVNFQNRIGNVISKHNPSRPAGTLNGEITLEGIVEEFETAMTNVVSAQKDKAEFVNTLNHEFRSPLQTIKGYAEYMKKGMAGSVNLEMKEILALISESSLRFEQFLSSVMNLVMIENKNISVNLEKTHIASIIKEIPDVFKKQAEKQNITINCEIKDGVNLVMCDPGLIHQILVHLVGNAFKFTSPNGAVNLKAHNKGGFTVLTVSDTGCGIPQDEYENVFRKFYQVKGISPNADHPKGLGIGLSICKAMIELQNGKIWLESVLGKGTDVYFTIPSAS